MENNNNKVSCSWWLGKHIDSSQSPWLQATLNDLDEKMKAVVSLIMQDDGDTFAQRAEMYYKNRTQLVKMMEEFHRSYRCLAERYDRLRPESDHATTSSNSFINVESRQNVDNNGANGNSTASTSDPNPAVSVCAAEDPQSNTAIEHEAELLDTKEECETDNNDEKDKCGRQIAMSCCENGDMWFDMKMQVSKLIEENIKQQSELIRRNNEKRKAIKDLCLQLDKLTEENMILRSPIPKLKGRLLGIILGGCPSRKECE
ncbi:hypothetical protein MKW98_030880 [Papaver atlanticum]|uniref:NAB domain-containing protein n=1 Tax=Papaver atlanticum TaxID=357466 RepID=A0AAD4T8T6_9MAGN|nr:hypothetical protein MKW98_030880 [Papaver atlanticum]